MAQNPKAPQEPSAFIEQPSNTSKDGAFIKSPPADLNTHFQTFNNRILAPYLVEQAVPTYIDEINGDSEKASDYLWKDARVKQDIVDVAKAVNGVDLTGKTQQEVAEWLLNERRNELGSLAMTVTEAVKTRNMGDELSAKYARLKQLYDIVPNFEGGVGETLASVGKAAIPELAASWGAGAVLNVGSKALIATGKVLPGVIGKTGELTSKYVLLGSASSDAAKLAAQKAIAEGLTKTQAAKSALAAGAVREMPAGAIWGASGSAAEQDIEKNAGLRDQTSLAEVAIGAGAGAVLGAGIGTLAHGAGGIIDANKYAKRLAKINNRTINEFTPTQLVQQYGESLDNQKSIIEARINELKSSTDPVDIEELAIRTQDLVDIETQRAGLKSLNIYPDQRQALIGDIANKQTPQEVDNILNGVDALDDAYEKIAAAADINDVHDALAKFGTQFNIDGQTLLQTLDGSAQPGASQPAQAASSATPAATEQPAPDAVPAAPGTEAAPDADETPLESLNADASKAADKLEPEPSTALNEVDARQEAAAQSELTQSIEADEGRVDELLRNATNLERKAQAPTEAETTEAPAASTKASKKPAVPATSKRKTRKDLNKQVAKELGVDEPTAAGLIDAFVAKKHTGPNKPTPTQIASHVESMLAAAQWHKRFEPALNDVITLADNIIQDLVDNKAMLPASSIVRMVEGRIPQVAPGLSPKDTELLLNEINAHVTERIQTIINDISDESLADFVAGIKLDDDALKALSRDVEEGVANAVEAARIDRISYNFDDYFAGISKQDRDDIEPQVRQFARKLALQIKRDHGSFSEKEQAKAHRVLVRRFIQNELRSKFPAQNKSALDQSSSTIFTDNDGEIISGRNQSKNVTGIVEVGDTQRVLREAEGGKGVTDYTWDQRNGGDTPRVARSDDGAPVGAIEAARRAIYRAATLRSGKGSGRLVVVKGADNKPIMEEKSLRMARIGQSADGKLFTETVMMDSDGIIHYKKSRDNWYDIKGQQVPFDQIRNKKVTAPKLRYSDRQPRVAPSSVIRELSPEITLARDEGNTTQYILIDTQTKEKLSAVTPRDARDIELYTAVEGYISGFAPDLAGKSQTPEQAFMRTIDTINKRYGRKVTEEETRSMMRSVMRGETIFDVPVSRRKPKMDKIELSDVLPASRAQVSDVPASASKARAIAISRASMAFARGELTEPQLTAKLDEIHGLSDDQVLEAAYKKIEAETAVTKEQQAAKLSAQEKITSGQTDLFNPSATPEARRTVTAADLDSTPDKFYSPRAHITVLRDNKGRIRKMFKGKSIRDIYGDDAIGWEIGFTPFKARNSAVAEVAFKNLATVDQPLRPMTLDDLAKEPITEANLASLTPAAFARISDAARGKPVSLRTIFDTITEMESAPWAATYTEFSDYLNDYRSLTNLLSSKTPNGIKLTTVYRTTAKRAINEIFSTSHPTDLVFLQKLLDNLGGNSQYGPMISRSDDGSGYIPPSQTGFEIRENSILIGDKDGPLRAYSFTHELAHWGFRNILTFEDRIKFLELMDKFYKAKTGEVDLEAVDGILPDIASNRLDSPQELFATQFTQWLFSQNKVFGGQQYAKTAFSDAANESIAKGFATRFKEAIKRIIYGKATRKGGDVDVVDEDFVPFFEQIMSSDEVRPSRVTIKPEHLKNEKSIYYLNMVNRLDERRIALEQAIQSFNPIALNEAIKDSLMFIRWMMKNSKSVKLYSSNLYSHMKVSTDENIINTIVEFHKRQESFDGLPDYAHFSQDDVSRIEDPNYVDDFSADMDDAYEPREFESYSAEADIYTANEDLVSEQQKAAMRLQNVIDFAISQAAKGLRKMEERDTSPSISSETDLASMLADVQLSEKQVPDRTDRRTSKQLRDALKVAIKDNDLAEVAHITRNLEYRGAAKLHFNESAVREDVSRTIQSDGSINTNFRSTPQERELLNAINHRDLKTATELRLLASRILSYNELGRTKPITNAELARAIGIESSDNSIATSSSPEFIEFRKYVKTRYESRNLWQPAPLARANNFDTDASSFSSGSVGNAFDELLNTNVSVTVKQVADFAIKNSRHVNPAYAVILKRIKDLDFINDIKIIKLSRDQFNSINPRRKRNPNEEALGLFFDSGPDSSIIYLADDIGNPGDTMGVLMHEMVHAAALSYLARDSKNVAKLNELFSEVVGYADALGIPRDSYYGLTNPDEFLAEAFTNGEFQDFLSNIFYNSDVSIFSKFVKWMSELLGIDEDTALLRAIRVGDSLFRENKNNKIALERELSASSNGMFSTQDYFALRGMTDSPVAAAYETPTGIKRLLHDDKIPPILGGAVEQEVGRPIFFKGKDGKFTLKPTARIPSTAAGQEIQAIDRSLYETYTRMVAEPDTETKSILEERFNFLLDERKAVGKAAELDDAELFAEPAVIDAGSIFRLDDKYQYVKEELSWLASDIGGDAIKRIKEMPDIVSGAQVKRLFGEEAILTSLRNKGIGAVTLGKDSNEITLVNATAEPVKPKLAVDRISYGSAEPSAPISTVLPVTSKDRTGSAFSAIAALAQQQGAPLDVVSSMKKIWQGKPLNPAERTTMQQAFDLFSENSQRLRTIGMRFVADFIKPENGVGIHEVHSSELAKRVVPIFSRLHQFQDAKNPIKRWARKSNPFATGNSQPDSHKRITAALRRGDIFALQGKEEREAFKEIQNLFQKELDEMRAEGLQVGDVRKGTGINGYLPQVWDADRIASNPNKFIDAMTEWFVTEGAREGDVVNPADARVRATNLMNKLSDDTNGVVSEAFGYAEAIGNSFLSRTLRLTTEDLDRLGLEEFMVNDLEGLVAKYFDATTRRRIFHKKFGIKDQAFNAYKEILVSRESAVTNMLTSSKSYTNKRTGIMPDGKVGMVEDEIPFIPVAINNAQEAYAEAQRLYQIAQTKDRTIAIPEIESAILRHYDRYVESGFYPEIQKRASAMANGIVESLSTSITRDNYNFLENAYAVSQNRMLLHGAGSDLSRKSSSALRTFNSVTLLAFTTIASFSDPAIALMRGGNMKAWAKAMAEYTTVPEYREASRRIGATISSVLHERLAHVYGNDSSKIGNAFFNATLLAPWTMRMRELSTLIGFEALRADAELAQRLAVKGNTNSRAYRMAKRRLDYYGLGEYAKPGPNSKSIGDITTIEDNDKWRYALMKFSNETIFEPNNNDIPIWAQTPIGKIMYQLKSFPHMMARTVMKSYSQNELERFLVPFLVVGPAMGAASLSIRDILQSRGGEDERSAELRDRRLTNSFSALKSLDEDADVALGWYMESMLAFGGLGLFADLIYQASEQADNGAFGAARMTSAILGPSIGTIERGVNIYSGLFSTLTGDEKSGPKRSAVRSTVSMIPFVGGNRNVRESAADFLAPVANKGGKSEQPSGGFGSLALEPLSIETPSIEGLDLQGLNLQE